MALNLRLQCNTLEVPEEDFLWPPGLLVLAGHISESTREHLDTIPGLQISSHRPPTKICQGLSHCQMSELLQSRK